MSAQPKLGILAGRGNLPGQLAHDCLARGREVFVVAFNGETDANAVADVPHAWVDVTAVGQVIRLLHEHRIEELCLIGPVGRPDFAAIRPDWEAAKLLPKIIAAARQGDDAIMKVVVGHLEKQGFRIVGAEAVLTDLAAPAGVLGAHRPNTVDEADIARGVEVIGTLGRLDIGQAVVVREGYVLAVEAAEGTDLMLERCRAFRQPEAAGVLVKLPKPGQERRADLPTIGPPTVRRCQEAGLRGIAIEASGTLIDDRDEVMRLADAAGLFIFGLEPGPEGGSA